MLRQTQAANCRAACDNRHKHIPNDLLPSWNRKAYLLYDGGPNLTDFYVAMGCRAYKSFRRVLSPTLYQSVLSPSRATKESLQKSYLGHDSRTGSCRYLHLYLLLLRMQTHSESMED